METVPSARIADILREEIAIITGREKNEVEPDKSLAENGINSLGFVELLLAVEKHFQVKLMENAMSSADISSVNALAAKIAEITQACR
ncbi:MAG: acyl carrier protein [Victivallaceae bacterium]|nr:acyl carrier protein [Victivallaceae bacterium]